MKNKPFKTHVTESHSSIIAALLAKKHQPNWRMLLDDYRQHWVTRGYSGILSSIIDVYKETKLRLSLKST
jgi:hypothetical protein